MTRRSAPQAKADAKATPSSGTPGYGSNETNETSLPEPHSKDGSSEGAVAAVAAAGLMRNGRHPHGAAGNGDAGHGSPGDLHGSAGALSNGSRQAQAPLSSSSNDSRQAQPLIPVSSLGQPLGSAGPVSSGEGMGAGLPGRMSSGEGLSGGGFAPCTRRQSAAFGRTRPSVDFARAGSVGHAAAETALPSPVRRRVPCVDLGPRCRARLPGRGAPCPRCRVRHRCLCLSCHLCYEGGASTVAAFGVLQQQPQPRSRHSAGSCALLTRFAAVAFCRRYYFGTRACAGAGLVQVLFSGGPKPGPDRSHRQRRVHRRRRRRSWRWRAPALRP